MSNLVPCPACHRHVRVAESACPFCRAALPTSLAKAVVPAASQRLTRAAAFAFTATLALTGCGDPTPAPTADSGPTTDVATDNPAPTDNPTPTDRPATDVPSDIGDGSVMPLYGAPVDASADTGTDASNDVGDGGVAPLYGAPADVPATDVVNDTGGGGVRYGAPPPSDGGGVMPLYGAVPAPDAGPDA